MRRRILIALLATVAASLILTGIGTLALSQANAKDDTERSLQEEAEGVALIVAGIPRGSRVDQANGVVNAAQRRQLLKKLRLSGIGFVVIGPNGRLATRTLPDGVSSADAEAASARLVAGTSVSGVNGDLAYAMAPRQRASGGTEAAVLTRRVENRSGPTGWFLIAAGATLVLATGVALWLSRTLTAPLRHAELATRRIAAGDLSTRVPDPKPGAHDELAALSRSINSMATTLERSRGVERQFLLSVSHDLRTPLTSIRGYAEAITDGTAPDDGAAAAVILSESRRLERLVRDLLDLATLEARRFSFAPREIELNEIAQDAASGFRREVEAAGLVLEVFEDRSAASAVVDPDRLAQVVANLVENAVKFTTTGVRVVVEAEAASVGISVADDGPGIHAEDLPHVFERLYVTRHRPVRKEAGSGLGLAIVRELVTAMGGTVAAASPPSGGARLTVSFPRVSPGEAAGTPPPEQAPPPP